MACSTLHHHHRSLFIPATKTLISPTTATNSSNKLGFPRRIRSASLGVRTRNSLRPAIDENAEGIISGEWPENISLLSYDDLRVYLETQILSEKISSTTLLGDVMSVPVKAVTAERTLEDIDGEFDKVSGLPVVDAELRCIGVVSKKDKSKASNGMKSKVGEVMSSPAITLSPDKTVMDAAALMLKEKIHRIPVVNEDQQIVGIVTRTDIFQALEAEV
ncbi:Uncharacterized protein M6B38_238105 [Iris pallida]|uniref:CBS domain-containing protein n=1 Tax=Iris pallida TaxID=29817 RepID=A0AAX6DL64_IRIPA|nr:Uncharacterized protein M6B38_238105 [Iris pallida]